MSGDVRIDPAAVAELVNDPDGPVAAELVKLAVRVESRAKTLCPVDTGRLRSSITHAVTGGQGGLACRVGSNVHYAPWVELGTRRMAPRAFLRRALAEVLGR